MILQVNTPKLVGHVNWTLMYLTVIPKPSDGRRTAYWLRPTAER